MSILSQPGLWVGAGVVLAAVLLSGRLTGAPWWRVVLAAAGALAFVVGGQWAWNLGIEPFIAAGLAALGIAIWDESAVRLLEARRRSRVALEDAAGVPAERTARPRRSVASSTVAVGPGRAAPGPAAAPRTRRPRRLTAAPDAKPVPRTPATARTKPASASAVIPSAAVTRAKRAAVATAPGAARAARRGARGGAEQP